MYYNIEGERFNESEVCKCLKKSNVSSRSCRDEVREESERCRSKVSWVMLRAVLVSVGGWGLGLGVV